MKQIKQHNIPVNRMNAMIPSGMDFYYLETGSGKKGTITKQHKNIVHRDDYYIFLFMKDSETSMNIDFEEIHVAETGNVVLYVRPGQVHFVSSFKKIKAWVLVMDPMFIEKDYKNTFECQFHTQSPVKLEPSVSGRLDDIARLLHTIKETPPTVFSNGIILNLANVFIGIIAEQYNGQQEKSWHKKSRPAQIAHRFKKLLSVNFKILKSPTQYARIMNYSLSHLNESVKKSTGFPVSYWIHLQILLEAKRLLYYTDMDIKEIAFSLGYEDHAYFSRLFSKFVGMPPGAFRRKFHE